MQMTAGRRIVSSNEIRWSHVRTRFDVPCRKRRYKLPEHLDPLSSSGEEVDA
jgi:hypothetical protein